MRKYRSLMKQLQSQSDQAKIEALRHLFCPDFLPEDLVSVISKIRISSRESDIYWLRAGIVAFYPHEGFFLDYVALLREGQDSERAVALRNADRWNHRFEGQKQWQSILKAIVELVSVENPWLRFLALLYQQRDLGTWKNCPDMIRAIEDADDYPGLYGIREQAREILSQDEINALGEAMRV